VARQFMPFTPDDCRHARALDIAAIASLFMFLFLRANMPNPPARPPPRAPCRQALPPFSRVRRLARPRVLPVSRIRPALQEA